MSDIRIPCPNCNKSLRLQDHSLLGRKVRCPKCSQPFTLQLPDEAPNGTQPAPAKAAKPARPASKSAATAKRVPVAARPTGADTLPAAPAAVPVTKADDATETNELAALLQTVPETGGMAQLRALRRKRAKRRNASLACLVLIGGLGAAAWYLAIEPRLAKTEPANAPTVAASASATDGAARQSVPAAPTFELPDDHNGDRTPIDLHYVPDGARIVFHLRPAELWQPGSLGEEFRFCLGPLGAWVEAKLKECCRREPRQIEEALICLIPGSPGTPPQRAVVVRLVEKFRMSDMLKEFRGEMTTEFGHTVYLDQEHAYLILDDLQTFAIGPRDLAGEMADAAERSATTSEGIEALMLETDRAHSLTMLFEPRDLNDYREYLFPPDLDPVVNLLVEWINVSEAEAVAWSLDLGDEFQSELLVRNQTKLSERQLREQVLSRLDALPERVLAMVDHMQPREVGRRAIIGRFPAMLKVFSLASQAFTGRRFVQVSTTLPERAAPNLAVGTLLTWDESTRTDFSAGAPKRSSGPKLPDNVVDRLNRPVEIEFIKMPLQDAFTYLGDETDVRVDIDGDALKLSGYTKNMEQNISLGMAAAMVGIQEILKKYDQMVVVANDADKSLLVTTKAAAEKQGLKPLVFQAP